MIAVLETVTLKWRIPQVKNLQKIGKGHIDSGTALSYRKISGLHQVTTAASAYPLLLNSPCMVKHSAYRKSTAWAF